MRYYLDVLLERVLERSLAQRVGYLAATVLALAALDYVLVYRHLAGGIVRATEALELARLDEARLRADLGRLPQLRGEIAALRRQLHSRLPRRPGTLTPLEDVSAQAAMAGLEVIRFHPGAARPGEHFAEVPTEVELKGAFHDLLRFLERAAGVHALLKTTNLTIDALAAEDGLATLRIALEMTAFRVRSPEPVDEDTPEPAPDPPSAGVAIGPLPRDPFQPYRAPTPPEPEGPNPDAGRNHPYEPQPAPRFRAVGIVWQKRTAVALVKDAEDFGHVVRPGARLGRHGYRIKAITPCEVVMETTRDDPASHETRLTLPRCRAFDGAEHPRAEPAGPRP